MITLDMKIGQYDGSLCSCSPLVCQSTDQGTTFPLHSTASLVSGPKFQFSLETKGCYQ